MGDWVLRIDWSRQALGDLKDHCDFIARDDPAAAILVEDRVLDAVERLQTHPLIGRSLRGDGTRDLVVSRTGIVVIYEVGQAGVAILHVRHQMRRPFERGG